MSERVELAKALLSARRPGSDWRYMTDRQQDGYLRSAKRLENSLEFLGYRKLRTVRTHQERATLLPGTICMDLAGNAWKRGTGSWVSTGEGGPLYDEENLTLIVLHEPEPQS